MKKKCIRTYAFMKKKPEQNNFAFFLLITQFYREKLINNQGDR